MDPKDLKPGDGAVMHVNGEDLAIYNDSGTLKAASAICTHQSCTIAWNGVDKSFDCPCHGSRFKTDFSVLEGPAEDPLEPRSL